MPLDKETVRKIAFLARIRDGHIAEAAYESRIEATLDALADHLEAHVAIDDLLAIARGA